MFKLIKNYSSLKAFTLIEILLALFIFAIVATISSSGLYAIIKAHERTDAKAKQLEQLQLTMIIMERDLQQIVNRPVIDNNGNQIAAIIANDHYLEFTHAGYFNPAMLLQRSTLQRTAYEFKDHELIRVTWAALDRAPATQQQTRVLLTNVNTINFQYLDINNKNYSAWPPIGNTTATNPLPKVIEITIDLAKAGKINRIFFIPAGAN